MAKFVIGGETLGLGGAEHLMVQLSNSLVNNGHRVHLLLTTSDDGVFAPHLNDEVTYEYCDDAGIFCEAAGRQKPDVFIMNNCRKAVATIPLIYEQIQPKMLVSWLHGYSQYTLKLCPPEYHQYIDRFLTISEESREGLHKTRPDWSGRTDVILAPVDTRRFTPRVAEDEEYERFGWDPGDTVYGYVGRLSHEKNPTALVQAYTRVLKVNPRARLLIVGGVDSGVPAHQKYWRQYYHHIHELTFRYNVVGKVAITGAVSDPERYYPLFDAFCITSHFEGLPLSMLEAMSSGIPVVSTAVGAVPELLSTGAGVTVEKQYDQLGEAELDTYAQAMQDILSLPEAGRRGREYVCEHHNLDDYDAKVKALVDQWLESDCRNGTPGDITEAGGDTL